VRGGAGHPDALFHDHLVGLHVDDVHLQARGAAAMVRNADLDSRPGALADGPELGGRPVAQRRIRAGGEDGGHPPGLAAERPMPDRIHAAVEGQQETDGDAVLDRPTADAALDELRMRDDAMLARRERRDHFLDATRRTLSRYFSPNVRLDRHAAMVATAASRITTESHQHRARTPPTQAPSRPRCAVRKRRTKKASERNARDQAQAETAAPP
jgi:hypothetical protein